MNIKETQGYRVSRKQIKYNEVEPVKFPWAGRRAVLFTSARDVWHYGIF